MQAGRNYCARQLSRWSRQYLADWSSNPCPQVLQLISELEASVPSLDSSYTPCLVHGDYRIDNIIFAGLPAVDSARVAATLDWELCTIGHPISDLAYFCLPFYLSQAAFRGTRLEKMALAEGAGGRAAFVDVQELMQR